MARPLRIEFPGAIYHVTARGNLRAPIFVDDMDRTRFLAIVGQAAQRFDVQVLAYCLMDNHYHLVLHTRQANLSLLMRHLNGVYTQTFNRRHGKAGHAFQGRFKAILVDRDSYLLQLCRYVELNPVRAEMVANPREWAWSSYLAHTGAVDTPEWLDTVGLHAFVLGRPLRSAADHRQAAKRYAELVLSVPDLQIWPEGLRQKIYLGGDDFVERMQAQVTAARKGDLEIPRAQRLTAKPFQDWLAMASSREDAIRLAYTQGGMTMTAIGAALGLSVSTVSRAISAIEGAASTFPPGCALLTPRTA